MLNMFKKMLNMFRKMLNMAKEGTQSKWDNLTAWAYHSNFSCLVIVNDGIVWYHI